MPGRAAGRPWAAAPRQAGAVSAVRVGWQGKRGDEFFLRKINSFPTSSFGRGFFAVGKLAVKNGSLSKLLCVAIVNNAAI